MGNTGTYNKKEKLVNGAPLKTPIWFLLSIFLFLSMVLAFFNERPTDLGRNNLNKTAGTALKKVVLIQKDFVGNIFDEKGMPIEDVAVSIGDKFIYTDINGEFIIRKANVKVLQADIVAEKLGYSKGLLTVKPTDGTNAIKIKITKENMVAAVVSQTKHKEGLLGSF